MSEQDIREMIDAASKVAERRFAEEGAVPPILMGVAGNDERFVLPVPMVNKDVGASMMRLALKLTQAKRCVFMCEGWTLDPKTFAGLKRDDPEIARLEKEGIADRDDKIEIVMFNGEDAEAGFISAQRDIIRHDNAKPFLGPLRYVVEPGHGRAFEGEGRMMGLLPRSEGKPQ